MKKKIVKTKNKAKITETAKVKIKKQKKSKQKKETNIYIELSLAILYIPVLVIILVSVFSPKEKVQVFQEDSLKISQDVRILTDKNIYSLKDEIVLIVKNNSGESVYFEPCEYLNNFEKQVDGKWVMEKKIVENISYDESIFDSKKSISKCLVKLPMSGKGYYRTVVNLYFDCEKPGNETCQRVKTFYSNEFEVE